MTNGRVENAVRRTVLPGEIMPTPSGRASFTVDSYTAIEIVLLLGQTRARTPLPWRALEEIPELLHDRDWALISGAY